MIHMSTSAHIITAYCVYLYVGSGGGNDTYEHIHTHHHSTLCVPVCGEWRRHAHTLEIHGRVHVMSGKSLSVMAHMHSTLCTCM